MSELKPCPFCGGEAKLENESPARVSFVKCKDCGARTYKYRIAFDHASDERAIKAWNMRAEE